MQELNQRFKLRCEMHNLNLKNISFENNNYKNDLQANLFLVCISCFFKCEIWKWKRTCFTSATAAVCVGSGWAHTHTGSLHTASSTFALRDERAHEHGDTLWLPASATDTYVLPACGRESVFAVALVRASGVHAASVLAQAAAAYWFCTLVNV